MLAYLLWILCACVFCVIGFYAFVSKKAVSIYANIKEPPKVSDVRAYNRAIGIVWTVSGIVMVLLGLPLLAGQNSPLALISIFGVAFECIALIAVLVFIEQKYRRHN